MGVVQLRAGARIPPNGKRQNGAKRLTGVVVNRTMRKNIVFEIRQQASFDFAAEMHAAPLRMLEEGVGGAPGGMLPAASTELI